MASRNDLILALMVLLVGYFFYTNQSTDPTTRLFFLFATGLVALYLFIRGGGREI